MKIFVFLLLTASVAYGDWFKNILDGQQRAKTQQLPRPQPVQVRGATKTVSRPAQQKQNVKTVARPAQQKQQTKTVSLPAQQKQQTKTVSRPAQQKQQAKTVQRRHHDDWRPRIKGGRWGRCKHIPGVCGEIGDCPVNSLSGFCPGSNAIRCCPDTQVRPQAKAPVQKVDNPFDGLKGAPVQLPKGEAGIIRIALYRKVQLDKLRGIAGRMKSEKNQELSRMRRYIHSLRRQLAAARKQNRAHKHIIAKLRSNTRRYSRKADSANAMHQKMARALRTLHRRYIAVKEELIKAKLAPREKPKPKPTKAPTPKVDVDLQRCQKARDMLNSVYTSNNFGNAYALNQNRVIAKCRPGSVVLGGGGSGPSCDRNNPACNLILHYEGGGPTGPGMGNAWSFYVDAGAKDGTYDTNRVQAVCVPQKKIDSFFSLYTVKNVSGDLYSRRQNRVLALCKNSRDFPIAGTSWPGRCDRGGNYACGRRQLLEFNGISGRGNRRGWYAVWDSTNSATTVYDNVGTVARCLRPNQHMKKFLRVYSRKNQGNGYTLSQGRTRASCSAGDVAVGGGGTGPRCDHPGNPMCKQKQHWIEFDGRVNKSTWGTYIDVGGDAKYDTWRTEVTCMGLSNFCKAKLKK